MVWFDLEGLIIPLRLICASAGFNSQAAHR